MLYSNVEFFILFLVTASLYLLLKKKSLRFYTLLLASLFFYSWAGFFDLLIFLLVILVSWTCVALARKYKKQKNFYIFLGISTMTLHLFFWKYASWLSAEIQKVDPHFLGGRPLHLPLPVGISFFTLQGIAYLVDYNRGKADFIDFKNYVLFKSFFPQLVAGPIVRASQLLNQIKSLPKPDHKDIFIGILLFAFGFLKKVYFADHISILIDPVFLNPGDYRRSVLIFSLLGYTVQIWADFSGYTDMGRGCARILGFKLPENFLSPYLAKSPSEFWKRWHITLSQWIRDYIYIPLGGSKGGEFRVFLVLVITMSISGLWHGANWTFLLWGFYHGLLVYFERSIRGFHFNFRIPSVIQFGIMTFATIFGWLIFRSQNLHDLSVYLSHMIYPNGTSGFSESFAIIKLSLIFCFGYQFFVFYNLESKKYLFENWVRFCLKEMKNSYLLSPKWKEVAIGCVLGFVISLLIVIPILLKNYNTSKAFIYFQF